MLLLTSMFDGITHKRFQWLAWRLLFHVSAFDKHEITWRRSYVAWLSQLLWKKNDAIFYRNPHSYVIIVDDLYIILF